MAMSDYNTHFSLLYFCKHGIDSVEQRKYKAPYTLLSFYHIGHTAIS